MWLLVVVGRTDPGRLAAGEQIARLILQIQRAVRKNAAAPDFEGLDFYSRHCADITGVVRTPTFDRFVSDLQKAEAQVLKQQRLSREEIEASEKTRKSKRTGGKDKKKAL